MSTSVVSLLTRPEDGSKRLARMRLLMSKFGNVAR
jgi:hypothetical protein